MVSKLMFPAPHLHISGVYSIRRVNNCKVEISVREFLHSVHAVHIVKTEVENNLPPSRPCRAHGLKWDTIVTGFVMSIRLFVFMPVSLTGE